MKEDTHEFLMEAMYHGFPLVASTHGTAKRIAWVIIIVAAIGAAIYFNTSLVIDFINSPTTTSITVESPPDGIEFPPIVLCNLHRLSRRLSAAYNITTQEQAEYLGASYCRILKIKHVSS